MSVTRSSFTERREETRLEGHSEGRMEAPKAFFPQSGPIVIEEASSCGLRLRSKLQLHPNEELVIRTPDTPLPIHTSVVWVHEAEAPAWGGHKTWIAGCHLHPDSIAKIRLSSVVKVDRFRGVGRTLLWLGVLLGGAAAVAYIVLRLASSLGAAGGLH